ncbi:mitochondrial import inner membrane translocase subunit 10 [Cavenderia fasciculata]|uniref:Mitochondrial import inner membrane translocase subunit n=1 Tax=Cavenderia fasciculata TaxID=261658 RepID=F4PSN7_CACFS|nr:mitochondrial import inner membrane translocase subunit 10 [Cavenderia fasciculata]EGG20729.1 mitochondrial import inner membrane translocase subunit 10 [Cavenderia fasciculata]|eukprot:XP_004358579.1 mitochondrial import inner membrane translocase subunit 10 [Cavenderia fasciculata]
MDDFEARVIEIKFYANFLQKACASKCVMKYSDSELAVGESLCAERCTEKWMETFKKVHSKMNAGAIAAASAAQQQEQAKPQQKKGWF